MGQRGGDRFYLGKIGTGILKLITGGGFGIWWLIDFVMAVAGARQDKEGRPIKKW
jgi:TM2 domain-containing membrane protein YozV